MSILAKENAKKDNLLKTKRILNIKMYTKGNPVFTFSLPGGRLVPLSPVSYATAPRVTFF